MELLSDLQLPDKRDFKMGYVAFPCFSLPSGIAVLQCWGHSSVRWQRLLVENLTASKQISRPDLGHWVIQSSESPCDA
jgi:hypothetical protein